MAWWELTLHDSDQRFAKALALSVQLDNRPSFSFYSTEEGRGPWIRLKKNKLNSVPVLDPRELTESQIDKLCSRYHELAAAVLAPVAKVSTDPVRASIDGAVAEAFELPSEGVTRLRHMLGSEPRMQPVPTGVSDDPLKDAPPELALF